MAFKFTCSSEMVYKFIYICVYTYVLEKWPSNSDIFW